MAISATSRASDCCRIGSGHDCSKLHTSVPIIVIVRIFSLVQLSFAVLLGNLTSPTVGVLRLAASSIQTPRSSQLEALTSVHGLLVVIFVFCWLYVESVDPAEKVRHRLIPCKNCRQAPASSGWDTLRMHARNTRRTSKMVFRNASPHSWI